MIYTTLGLGDLVAAAYTQWASPFYAPHAEVLILV